MLERLLVRANVSEAARDLGVGQPAVSKSLHRLRALLGDPLLVRRGRVLARTHRGEELLGDVQTSLALAARVFEPVTNFVPAEATGVFRLALGDDMQTVLISKLLSLLGQRAPGIDLRVSSVTPDWTERLDHGRIDLAVAPDLRGARDPRLPDLTPFVIRPLLREDFVVVSREPRALDLGAYVEARHVLVSTGQNDTGIVDLILAARGLRRRVVLAVPTFHQAVLVVSRSELLATLPGHASREARRSLYTTSPPLPVPALDVVLVWAPRSTSVPRSPEITD